MSPAHTLIVGVGSPHGDDQIGWVAVDQLAACASEHTELRKAKSPTDLLHWLQQDQWTVICDACRGMGPIGSVRRWTWPTSQLQEVAWSGTHDLSLTGVLTLAERLGRLSERTIIWGVEAAPRAAFEGCSPAAMQGVAEVVGRIAAELEG